MSNLPLPGRIYFRENGEANSYALIDQDAIKWVMSLLVNGEHTTARQTEILERMAACWNACEGIPTDTLEAVGTDRQFWPLDLEGSTRKGLVSLLGIQNFTVQELKRQVESETRAKLKDQRDELLEALTFAASATSLRGHRAARDIARAAITKLKGGPA